MSVPETLMQFFDACETGKGAEGVKHLVTSSASFSCQADSLKDIHTVLDYADWMKGVCTDVAPDGHYELHNALYDREKNTAVFFATFHGTHPPTGKMAHAEYVYVITHDAEGKVIKMIKVWNDVATFKQFGILE